MEGSKDGEQLRHRLGHVSGMEHRLSPSYYPSMNRYHSEPTATLGRQSESSSGQSELEEEAEADEEYSNLAPDPLRSSGNYSASSTRGVGGRSRKKKSNVKYKDHCDNCLTSETPQWRKGRRGETFCQDCGRSERRHDYARLRKRRSKAISKILKDVLENSTFISVWDDSPEPSQSSSSGATMTPYSFGTSTETVAGTTGTTATLPARPMMDELRQDSRPPSGHGIVQEQATTLLGDAWPSVEQIDEPADPGSQADRETRPVAGTAASEAPNPTVQQAGEEARKRRRDHEAEVAGHTKKGPGVDVVKRDVEDEPTVDGKARMRMGYKDPASGMSGGLYVPNLHVHHAEGSRHDVPEHTRRTDKRKKTLTAE
jgi:hypothetical protein